MAVAVAIGNITQDPAGGLDSTRSSLVVFGTLTLSANYGGVSSHGDTVSFAVPQIATDYLPKIVLVTESVAAGSAGFGYQYTFYPGTTLANGVLNIKGTGAASGQGGTEITEGSAYSTFTPSLNGAVLNFMAWFCKNV